MKFSKSPILKLSGVLHTFGGGSHLGDWDGPGKKYKKSLEFQLKFDFGNFFIAGPQTPPPNSGTPPQKVLSNRPILIKQKPKYRSWSKLSFG